MPPARVPAALIGAFTAVGSHSMMIETKSAGMVTGIRFGNTGAQDSLPRLTAACQKSIGEPRRLGGAQDRRDSLGEVTYSAACAGFFACLASI